MPKRVYLYLNVAIAAIAAAGIVVGLTLDTRSTPHQPKAQAGKPPVPRNVPGPAGRAIEAAFRDWPHGSIDTMQRLGLQYAAHATPAERRTSAIVEFYRGVALFWAGYVSDAESALENAKTRGRNTMIHNQADAFLHPGFLNTGPPFYPVFQTTAKNTLLQKGTILQVQGRQISAENAYRKAAQLDPKSIEAQVAVAVGLFDEDDLNPTFSRLGPLTAAHPDSQVAHYYFGLVLAWTGSPKAIAQFKKAYTLAPETALGKQAEKILAGVAGAKSSGSTGT